MSKTIDTNQVLALKRKPKEELTLAEIVFLQGIEIQKLNKLVATLKFFPLSFIEKE